MSSLGQLNIQLLLDTIRFKQALSRSDQQVQRFVRNFIVDMDKSANAACQFSNRTADYLNNIEGCSRSALNSTPFSQDFLIALLVYQS